MNINTEQYFSTVPEIHAPRSVFDRSFTHKTTMNCDYLYPIFIDEALPGDSFKMHFQVFGRLLNPLVVPVMDELYFETLWFKIPNRLVWTNWKRFCGEQDNPTDSVDYLLPTIDLDTSNDALVGTIFDYYGIPTQPASASAGYAIVHRVNSLPFRCYNLVYNQWMRDENLINSVPVPMGDTDSYTNYTLLKSSKIHDYFTSMLPFSQKGASVALPFDGFAPVVQQGELLKFNLGMSNNTVVEGQLKGSKNLVAYDKNSSTASNYLVPVWDTPNYGDTLNFPGTATGSITYKSGLKADLRNITGGADINDFRFAIKLQRKREIDAVSGSRYIEFIKAHFNVDSPDARLQRSEFLGSTRELIDINSVVQTSSTDSTSAQGHITAYGIISNHESGFSTSFTEHSYVLGIARIRQVPLYQQGINKLFKRSSLLDFYLPVFNGIGEQPVKKFELVATGINNLNLQGDIVDDEAVGFQEAWADYRYRPNMISGILRSGITTSLDAFHFAQYFVDSHGSPVCPNLNQSFIESGVPVDRSISVNTSKYVPQFVMDFRFNYECARPMPVRNIPDSLCHQNL